MVVWYKFYTYVTLYVSKAIKKTHLDQYVMFYIYEF